MSLFFREIAYVVCPVVCIRGRAGRPEAGGRRFGAACRSFFPDPVHLAVLDSRVAVLLGRVVLGIGGIIYLRVKEAAL